MLVSGYAVPHRPSEMSGIGTGRPVVRAANAAQGSLTTARIDEGENDMFLRPTNAPFSPPGTHGSSTDDIATLRAQLELKSQEAEDLRFSLTLLEAETRYRVENAEKSKKKEVDSAQTALQFKVQELARSEQARKGLQKSLKQTHQKLVALKKGTGKQQLSSNGVSGSTRVQPSKENGLRNTPSVSSMSTATPQSTQSEKRRRKSGEERMHPSSSLSPEELLPASQPHSSPPKYFFQRSNGSLPTIADHTWHQVESVASIFAETSADLLVLLGVMHLMGDSDSGASDESGSTGESATSNDGASDVLRKRKRVMLTDSPAVPTRGANIGLFSPEALGPYYPNAPHTGGLGPSPFSLLRQRYGTATANASQKRDADRLLLWSFQLYTQLSRVLSSRDDVASLIPHVMAFLESPSPVLAEFQSAALGVLRKLLSLCPLSLLRHMEASGEEREKKARPNGQDTPFRHPRLSGFGTGGGGAAAFPKAFVKVYAQTYSNTMLPLTGAVEDDITPMSFAKLKQLHSTTHRMFESLAAQIRVFYQDTCTVSADTTASKDRKHESARRLERCVEIFHLLVFECDPALMATWFMPFLERGALSDICVSDFVHARTKRLCLSMLQKLVSIFPTGNVFAWGLSTRDLQLEKQRDLLAREGFHEKETSTASDTTRGRIRKRSNHPSSPVSGVPGTPTTRSGRVFRLVKLACLHFLTVPQSWWQKGRDGVSVSMGIFNRDHLPLMLATLRVLSAILAHHEKEGIHKLILTPGRKEENVFILLIGLVEALTSPLQTYDRELSDHMYIFTPIKEGLVIILVLLQYLYQENETFEIADVCGQHVLNKLLLIKDRILNYGEDCAMKDDALNAAISQAENLRALLSHD